MYEIICKKCNTLNYNIIIYMIIYNICFYIYLYLSKVGRSINYIGSIVCLKVKIFVIC